MNIGITQFALNLLYYQFTIPSSIIFACLFVLSLTPPGGGQEKICILICRLWDLIIIAKHWTISIKSSTHMMDERLRNFEPPVTCT